ncbi:MAG: hypothetical protein J0L85_14860 [Zoogloea sp.]|nr:hypothetical protein [Zoogloea sp.]
MQGLTALHDFKIIGLRSAQGCFDVMVVLDDVEKQLGFVEPLVYRVVDYGDQNVISRFFKVEKEDASLIYSWVEWIFSDSQGGILASEEGKARARKEICAGQRCLYVIEPSWGAEIAVIASAAFVS